MRWALSLVLAVVVASSASEPLPPALEDAVQDRTGCVWAYGQTGSGRLYRFGGGRWQEEVETFDDPDLTNPAKLVRMADGSVACVWRVNNQRLAVTRHLGTEPTRLLGTCEEPIGPNDRWPKPLADSKNRLWITGEFPRIYCVDERGLSLAHTVAPGEWDRPFETLHGCNELRAVEDGQGRIWAWSVPTAAASANLRDALVVGADGHVESRALTASLKGDARVLALARADEHHLWMSVKADGVYRVESDTLALERTPDPAPKALGRVYDWFVHGADVYAVEGEPHYRASLWRWRGTEWTRMLADIDGHAPGSLARSWLPVDGGLLVQGIEGNLWFVPTDGNAVPLTWHTGFPLEDAHALSRFTDGTFFALGAGGFWFHGPLELPLRERPHLRLDPVDTDRPWIVDADGHPWTTMRSSPRTPSKWNGETWTAHPPPMGSDEAVPAYSRPLPAAPLRVDAEGRVWVLGDRQRPLRVLDTRTGQWQTFAGLREAYVALRDRPPHFLGDDPAVSSPQYAGDGRKVAYRDAAMECQSYDGTAWRVFNRKQIGGAASTNGAVGPPWFDREDRLRVNIRPGGSWRLEDDGRWTAIPFEGHYPDDTWSEARLTNTAPPPPAGCVTEHPESIVRDNRGVCWLTWRQEVYRAVPGRCVKVLASDETQPFVTGRRLERVYIDGRGNALLGAGAETFVLRPKQPPPRTTVALEPVGTDGVRARLRVEPAPPAEVRWRLDDGPWQATYDDTLTLRDLPGGSHRLTVSALDGELQSEPVPLETAFEIRVDPESQITDLIAGLSDPDYARRKAAADALARQPGRAVPALRSARQSAGADLRWWIDATLGQIERAGGTPPNGP